MTIYTLWADRIIAGTARLNQVPKDFQPRVRQILESQKCVIEKNGTAHKRNKKEVKIVCDTKRLPKKARR